MAAAAAAAGCRLSGTPPVTPGSSSTPNAAGPGKPAAAAAAGASVTPRNSIARLISGRGGRGGGGLSPAVLALSSPGLLGPDGVPVGSLFAIADKLTQAAAAALATARAAFNEATEEEAKVGLWGGRGCWLVA